jgi:hypothetical protein
LIVHSVRIRTAHVLFWGRQLGLYEKEAIQLLHPVYLFVRRSRAWSLGPPPVPDLPTIRSDSQRSNDRTLVVQGPRRLRCQLGTGTGLLGSLMLGLLLSSPQRPTVTKAASAA